MVLTRTIFIAGGNVILINNETLAIGKIIEKT
jgi:hypothetical protein